MKPGHTDPGTKTLQTIADRLTELRDQLDRIEKKLDAQEAERMVKGAS